MNIVNVLLSTAILASFFNINLNINNYIELYQPEIFLLWDIIIITKFVIVIYIKLDKFVHSSPDIKIKFFDNIIFNKNTAINYTT